MQGFQPRATRPMSSPYPVPWPNRSPAAASVYRFRVPSKQAGKKPGVGGDHVHDAGGVRADPARGWSAGTLLLAPDEIAPNMLTKFSGGATMRKILRDHSLS